MTYSEALDDCLSIKDGYGSTIEVCEGYSYVEEACEKADKYRWHDLRKNPEDLPTDENVRYLIYATVKPICENRYYTAKLIKSYDGIYSLLPSPFLDVDVIAWSDIEQFEEG